jgi:hypothetical protein
MKDNFISGKNIKLKIGNFIKINKKLESSDV